MKPDIKILATGGTIAGSSSSATDTANYTAGAIGVDALIATVPHIRDFAEVTGEQICNIDSKDITDGIWLKLANRTNELLNGDVDGIVVTHGTDTLEETAYFLNLTVHSDKPVVLTGAMRPATAISSDGTMNLLNAVKVAVSPQSVGKGVLVVMNDEIHAAREVTKTHTLNVGAFRSPEFGLLGYVGEVVNFYRTTTRRHTLQSEFSVEKISELPAVKIIYGHANDDGLFVEVAIAAGVKGIICAGTGNGSIHANVYEALTRAVNSGIVVVRSSRVGSGFVTKSDPFLSGGNLSPQKARILLQLALTKTNNLNEIQRMFEQY